MILQTYVKNDDLRKIDHIYRFQGSPIIQTETITSHSWWVAFFARILPSHIFNEELLIESIGRANYDTILLNLISFALFHDVREIVVGDILFTVKYNSHNGNTLREALNDYEEIRMVELFGDENLVTQYSKSTTILYQKHILKICDWCSLLKQLQNEYSLGNRNLDDVLKNTKIGLLNNIDALRKQLGISFNKDFVNENFFQSFIDEINDFKL
jgi:5'-deoxynucleotidase YfbR-like HD superfamily hydrolase